MPLAGAGHKVVLIYRNVPENLGVTLQFGVRLAGAGHKVVFIYRNVHRKFRRHILIWGTPCRDGA